MCISWTNKGLNTINMHCATTKNKLSLYIWFAVKACNFFKFPQRLLIILLSSFAFLRCIPTFRRNILAAFGQIFPYFSHLIDTAISSQTLQNSPGHT